VADVTSATFAAGGAGLELFQRGDDPLGEQVELAVLADA
jgi:hypothetical protein